MEDKEYQQLVHELLHKRIVLYFIFALIVILLLSYFLIDETALPVLKPVKEAVPSVIAAILSSLAMFYFLTKNFRSEDNASA